jgi:hypothetical protein
MSHAGDYAATLHYLKALANMGVAVAKADGRAVVARMKARWLMIRSKWPNRYTAQCRQRPDVA